MSDKIVIIPTYNEIDNIENIIYTVFSIKEDFDILVIDDNSPDGTAEVIKRLQSKYPDQLYMIQRSGKLGLGTAYIKGFTWALEKGYNYIFEMDADFSHDPNDLVYLYNACYKDGADLAIGSRYIQGVNVVNWPMGRVLMSYFASAYVRFITGMKIKDTTAGFKCYKSNVLKSIDFDKIKFKGYAFQIEMKFYTWKLKFKIIEVPIIFTDRRKGTSKMSGSIFNEAFWGVIIMKLRGYFNYYSHRK